VSSTIEWKDNGDEGGILETVTEPVNALTGLKSKSIHVFREEWK
jgi:hypothetical protein